MSERKIVVAIAALGFFITAFGNPVWLLLLPFLYAGFVRRGPR